MEEWGMVSLEQKMLQGGSCRFSVQTNADFENCNVLGNLATFLYVMNIKLTLKGVLTSQHSLTFTSLITLPLQYASASSPLRQKFISKSKICSSPIFGCC